MILFKEAAILEKDGKISFICGFLDELADLPLLTDIYGADCAENLAAAVFIANIGKPMRLPLGGFTFLLMPLTQGFIWNELVEVLGMEKSDFKGQSAGDKVITLADEFRKFQPQYDTVELADALNQTTQGKREMHGAV